MPQLFRPVSNTLAKVLIAAALCSVGALLAVGYIMDRGPWITTEWMAPEQPVPFSHKHHVGDDGIDCRYCHTGVENSAFAGLPPTETCMTCHSQIWTNATLLAPVRESWQNGNSVVWTRVHSLPDFVYFNHSIHINKGIGCSTCHGRVDKMALTYRVNNLYMGWCINCHRDPAKFIRPRSEVFNIAYQYPANQAELGAQLVKEYHVKSPREITDCFTCHR